LFTTPSNRNPGAAAFISTAPGAGEDFSRLTEWGTEAAADAPLSMETMPNISTKIKLNVLMTFSPLAAFDQRFTILRFTLTWQQSKKSFALTDSVVHKFTQFMHNIKHINATEVSYV
jgi:hypothetical protein